MVSTAPAGDPVDVIMRKARAFSIEQFGRRPGVDLPFARGVAVVTPEDAILSKLEWASRAEQDCTIH